MLYDKEYLAEREHYHDLLREAAAQRIGQQALAARGETPGLLTILRRWLAARVPSRSAAPQPVHTPAVLHALRQER